MLTFCRWLGIIAALFIQTAAAQPRPPAQTPDEVRTSLRAWDWEGDWFMDCEHQDQGGHYVAVLGETGFPVATMFYDGKLTGEGRITAARIDNAGALTTVTESRSQLQFASQTTMSQVKQGNSFQVLSVEAEFEAIVDIAPRAFGLKPEGMAKGAHVHSLGVRDSMVLDRFEKPVRPTSTYRRCGQLVS